MKKCVKVLSATLAALMLIAMLSVAGAANFADTAGHWSESYVDKASDNGLVNGVGGGNFNPNATVSTAEWVTMLVNLFYTEERNANQVLHGAYGGWWYAYMVTAADAGILAGTVAQRGAQAPVGTQSSWSFGSGEHSPEREMSRFDMAQVVYNLALAQDWDVSAADSPMSIPDGAAIPAQYRSAVSYCYNAGFITGVDGFGTFDGSASMTRGAAAVVLCRLLDRKESVSALPVQIPLAALEADRASLNGIAISSTITEVETLLGTPKATYDYDGGTTTVMVYHNGSYGAFYLIGYQSDKAVYVYTVSRAYTIEDDSVSISKVEYTDSGNGRSVYAASIATRDFPSSCSNDTNAEKLVFELTNAFRALNGVSTLTWDSALGKAAHNHTQNMYDYKKMTHDGLGESQGLNFSARAKASGYTGFPAGENCAAGHVAPMGFVNTWINSSGHRTNMLNSLYQHMGVGVVGGYATQVFGYFLSW
jgi:Uncharacterized protein with SCP/PR1 domains